MHPCLLHNDRVIDARELCVSPGQVGLLNGWGVFSTIRVLDGVLFEYPRHWARLVADARKLRVPMPESAAWLQERLLALVAANHAENATLRVAIVRNRGGMWEGPAATRDWDVVAFTAPVNDWGTTVKLGVVANARFAANEFANAKMLSWAPNLTWYERAHEQGYDEVVLLNERGEVAECTSANIFAVFGDRVLTPPLSSGCLPGITRELLLEGAVAAPAISVGEMVLTLPDLERADEVFITSTTRELLHVVSVGVTATGTSDRIRSALQDAFTLYSQEYVRQHRRPENLDVGNRFAPSLK
jgi:branched-chain amino acid aminotransferase